MELSAIAARGISRAEQRIEHTAARLAAATTEQADAVDLSAQMVSLLDSRNQWEANLKVLKTAEDLDKKTLDVLG